MTTTNTGEKFFCLPDAQQINYKTGFPTMFGPPRRLGGGIAPGAIKLDEITVCVGVGGGGVLSCSACIFRCARTR